jgi:protein gp37
VSDKSAIEWTDATWNPFRGFNENRWMCRKVSPGCDQCYASRLNQRFGGRAYPTEAEVNADPAGWRGARLDEKALSQPLHWRQPRMIFVCSMTDLFGEWVPDEWIDRVFSVMALSPQHTYQVLTKRPKRMAGVIDRLGIGYGRHPLYADEWPLPNVWLGTSIELDRYAWRASSLRAAPAAVRFISAEPLLGPLPSLNLDGISWLITGGESGRGHRPCDEDWVRDLRDHCQSAGVAFFHKQWGGLTPKAGGRLLDGRTWDEFPAAARPAEGAQP